MGRSDLGGPKHAQQRFPHAKEYINAGNHAFRLTQTNWETASTAFKTAFIYHFKIRNLCVLLLYWMGFQIICFSEFVAAAVEFIQLLR